MDARKIEFGQYKEKSFVLPVKELRKANLLLVIQCEYAQSNPRCFKHDDKPILAHVGGIMAANIERIIHYIVSNQKIMKTISLIETFKDLLNERSHSVIYDLMQKSFARLFDYERVGILFKDDVFNCLYMINVEDYQN